MGAQSPDDLDEFSRPQLCGSLDIRTPGRRTREPCSHIINDASPCPASSYSRRPRGWPVVLEKQRGRARESSARAFEVPIVRIPLAGDGWTNLLAWFRVDIDGGTLARFRQS